VEIKRYRYPQIVWVDEQKESLLYFSCETILPLSFC
jgi:hypothetical protein